MFGSSVCVKYLPLVLLLAAEAALPAEHEKLSVPDEAARAKAWATIQDVFDADTTVAELLKNAGNVRKNPAAYWALLDMASTKAAEEGNIELTMQAVDALADAFDNMAQTRIISPKDGVPAGWRILDIGPKTLEVFQRALDNVKTVVWNGPMGVFEMDTFAKVTREVALLLGGLTETGANTIIGGGDSAAAVTQANLADKMSHISTGGGASLELLEGRTLPGVAALQDRE